MTDHDRYPETDPDETPGPLDPIIDVLREADASHEEKAIALTATARTEFGYAVEDGQITATDDFLTWVSGTLELLDDVLEAYAGE